MAAIQPGSVIHVRDFKGAVLTRVALSSVVDGRDFPVVWACTRQEWDSSGEKGRPEGLPWPAEDIVDTDVERPS